MILLKWFSRMMIHPIIGKIIGVFLIILPIILIIIKCYIEISLITIIGFITLTYLGLFIGAIVHEFGHVLTLRIMGVKTKVSIMKNNHSRIIFFNMRTELKNDHPLHSTSDKLLLRGLSGFSGNMIAYCLLITLGYYFNNPILLYLAAVQAFSGHGATSLTDLNGDTDVRTLREGLSIQDEIKIHINDLGNNEAIYNININLKILSDIVKNYWVIVEGVSIDKFEGDFLSFDMGSMTLFVIQNFESGSQILKIWSRDKSKIKAITKNGSKSFV